jgi:hypothetical protein
MKLSEIFKFILLIVVFGLLFLYIKKSADLIIEQKLKEKECINKRVEINGSSYLIVDHDWFKDCYILDNGLSVDEELIWELLKEQK